MVGVEELRTAFREEIQPYLLKGQRSRSSLRHPQAATQLFKELRNEVDERAHGAIGALEDCCEQRRQFDRQRRLHWWLHSWLYLHLPLSLALLLLLLPHIWLALEYM